jgi:hypothetical protein
MIDGLGVCLGLRLRNKAYKLKRAFGQKLYFQAFVKSVFLAIFRLFELLKVLLIFLSNLYFFL